jgi:hypothetical protein
MLTQMVIWENYYYERRTEHAKEAKKLGHGLRGNHSMISSSVLTLYSCEL